MQRLTAMQEEEFDKAAKLAKAMRANLKGLGYEI
jgi:hypothetical protein